MLVFFLLGYESCFLGLFIVLVNVFLFLVLLVFV